MNFTPNHRPFEATERLAKRVLGGQVVFFVGAGFSIDSEKNTAGRLIARLLARVLALGSTLAREDHDGAPLARELLEKGLGRVFAIAEAKLEPNQELQPARCMTSKNVALLAREYFNFNEWVSSALGVLARQMLAVDATRRAPIAARVRDLERFLLGSLETDGVLLDEIEWRKLEGRRFERDADLGKALFLDTMGFANQEIMGGEPGLADARLVAESYGERLLPRHHALARLAREGLLSCVITTNYDLLLEGAYRVAGFVDRESAEQLVDRMPATSVPQYSRIAGAEQFFARGDDHRTALLLKIHGCVENYRSARAASLRDENDPTRHAFDAWRLYLPALVFTYREIQTWRSDAWSRDLVRTLLRTHTLALCGYSGADPVMHSTFREVYEEMAQLRAIRGVAASQGDSSDAPLFFFDMAGKREFHSLEILRAATEAGGYPKSDPVGHPNQIEFRFTTSEQPYLDDHFPNVDDHLRWLTHRVLREMQARALKTRLRRLAPRLLGYPCPEGEHDAICNAFQELRAGEDDLVASAAGSRSARRAFDATVGWTWSFLAGLLRELALAELLESNSGPGRSVHEVRRSPWYFPASERLEWTAWAAVVELALRRMIAGWRGDGATALRPDVEWIASEESPHAVVSFARGVDQRQRYALCIRVAGLDELGRSPAPTGAFRRVTTWELGEQDVPWRTRRLGRCPSAKRLWDVALGERPWRAHDAFFLGADDERPGR